MAEAYTGPNGVVDVQEILKWINPSWRAKAFNLNILRLLRIQNDEQVLNWVKLKSTITVE